MYVKFLEEYNSFQNDRSILGSNRTIKVQVIYHWYLAHGKMNGWNSTWLKISLGLLGIQYHLLLFSMGALFSTAILDVLKI